MQLKMTEKLFDRYDFSGSISGFNPDSHMCQVLTIDNVYNLVLKKNPSKKAKYKKMRCVLENLKTEMEVNLVTKVAMPKIGCGHEGLDWDKVRKIIEEVLNKKLTYLNVEALRELIKNDKKKAR